MPPFIGELMIPGIGTELIYSFVIIFCSLVIYFETKELYELSTYKGINYFRQAFLFFGIAYFFRYFIKFLIGYFGIKEILDLSPRIVGQISLFLFIYFSTIAIFYLIYSMMWKRWGKKEYGIYIFHGIALLTCVLSLSFRNPLIYLIINFFLFIFAVSLFLGLHKERKKYKKNNLHTIYALLFTFWSLNMIDVLIPDFLQNTQLFIYLISLGIFLTILYKVTKKSGSN
jgi:hypothetical protein